MNIGDVVVVKPFYETLEIIDGYGIILDIYEDDAGFEWYKVRFDRVFEWFEDYKLQLVSECALDD
tara:strand:+ start:734 stop:928 length:195 start_codon:yes stop_codon:yes gene_type:complete